MIRGRAFGSCVGMKYLRLLVVVVVLLGGVYALWQFGGADATEKKDLAPVVAAAEPAVAKGTGVAAPKMSGGIAGPVSPPTATVAAKAAAAATVGVARYDLSNPQPQLELNDCIEQSLQLFAAKNYAGLIKTLLPPTLLRRPAGAPQMSVDDMAANMAQNPNTVRLLTEKIQPVMESLKGLTPEFSADGNVATFKIDPAVAAVSGKDVLTFIKADGYWHMK